MKHIVSLLFVMMSLVGCSNLHVKPPVQTKPMVATIDRDLLLPIIPKRPISQEAFDALSKDEQTLELVRYNIHLLETITQLNRRLTGIRKEIEGQTMVLGDQDGR